MINDKWEMMKEYAEWWMLHDEWWLNDDWCMMGDA